MDQLKRLLDRLSWAQRIWLVVAALAVGGGLAAFSNWNKERAFKPLYTNLAADDAGALVNKLKENGVEYRLADNGSSILVSSDRIGEARLTMASAGLPKSGRIGFELFDKANFGASDFAEQINYHRAIEGKLERSVMAIAEVEQARIHITWAKDSIYTESRQPAKASVLIKLRPGARLSPQNVIAICQLAASAVPELSVDQVALVDTNGALLNRPRRNLPADSDGGGEAGLEYRKSVEKDLQTKIAATLDPLLGAEHFRVGVSAEVDVTSADQNEEIYDPQKSAVLSSQTTQDGPASPMAAGGVPGTASNLPRAAANTAPAASASNYARKTESVTYQPSRIVKHTKIPQGAITKLSLSVLVDHNLRWEGTKRVVEAPAQEKLKVIHDLVAAAAGFSMDRGDQLVVEAFPFEATLNAEPPLITPAVPSAPAPPSRLPPWLQKLVGTKNFTLIAAIGGGALLALLAVVGVIVVRGRKGKKISAAAATAALAASPGGPRELSPAPEDMQQRLEAQMAEQAAQQARREAEELMRLKMPEVTTKKTEVLTKHIAAEAKKNPGLMAQVVRSWLNG